jgi:hypothetical protein
MTVPTVDSLRTTRRRLKTRLEKADAVLAEMRAGCVASDALEARARLDAVDRQVGPQQRRQVGHRQRERGQRG